MLNESAQLLFRALLLFSMLFALTAVMWRYGSLDKALKIFAVYIAVSFLDETLAYFAALFFRNNQPVYFVYGVVEIVFVSLFFNYAIDIFRKNNLGIYIGGVLALFGIFNGIFIQSIKVPNHYFLFVESVGIIFMALFFFTRLMLTHLHDQVIYHNPHFLIAALLTFFWTANFLSWGFLYYNAQPHVPRFLPVEYMIYIVNYIYYTGIGIVFLLHPKFRRIKWKLST